MLREAADGRGFKIATCVRRDILLSDAKYREVLNANFNAIVPEQEMKEAIVHKGIDDYNFDKANDIVNFAIASGKVVRGHVLVWPHSRPFWQKESDRTYEQWKVVFEGYIKSVVRHFKGKLFCWDAVNEAVGDNGLLRHSFWNRVIGAEHLKLAFRYAREADPDVPLFYCDYKIFAIKKWESILQLVRELRDEKLIDGIAVQLHYEPKDLLKLLLIDAFLARLKGEGLKIHCSEISLCAWGKNIANEAIERSFYPTLLKSCLKYCELFGLWGFSNKYPYSHGNREKLYLFDEQLQPKSVVGDLLKVLEAMP